MDNRDIRSMIVDAVSDCLDNPDHLGIYPTTKLYNRLEEELLARERQHMARIREAIDSNQPYEKDWVGTFDGQRIKNALKTISDIEGGK